MIIMTPFEEGQNFCAGDFFKGRVRYFKAFEFWNWTTFEFFQLLPPKSWSGTN